MKTKSITGILLTLFLASMLSMAFVTPAKAQYLVDPYTVGLWHLDGNAEDSSPNNNDGTVYGATYVPGKFGQALSFDGVDDYVNIPDAPSLDITGDITLEAWIWIKSFSTSEGYHMYILSKDTISQRSYGIGVDLVWERPQKPYFIVFDGTTYKVAWGTTTLAIETWYHIMGVFYASTGDLKLYLNGVLESTEPSTMSSIFSGSADLRIGARQYPGHQCFFNGIIDEVRISDVARGPVDIDPDTLNLKSKGSWITGYIEVPGWTELFKDDFEDETAGSLASKWSVVTGTWLVEEEADGNMVYSQSETPTGRVTYAYLDVEFTDGIIEAKIKSISGTKGQHIAWRSDGGVNSNYYWFGWAFSPDRVRWGKFVGGVGTEVAAISRDFSSGVWYTLKVVASGTHFDMYLDGELIFSIDDATFTSGSIGFHCGDHTHFDDAIVTSYVSEVDLSTVNLYVGETAVGAETDPKYSFVTDMYSYIADADSDGILERMVKFSRAAVGTLLEDYVGQEVSLTISGQYLDGTGFYLSYTVKVIRPGK